MAKAMDKLGIMNLMAGAAHKKAQMPSKKNPDPDHDGDNDMSAKGDTDGDYSGKAQKAISGKMHKMKNEDKPQKQKVAIAISEARQKGLKVPSK